MYVCSKAVSSFINLKIETKESTNQGDDGRWLGSVHKAIWCYLACCYIQHIPKPTAKRPASSAKHSRCMHADAEKCWRQHFVAVRVVGCFVIPS